jgi:PKD repeat protein
LHEQAVILCDDTVRVNTPVLFDGSDSYLPGFNIGRYLWEFGDGTYGEGRQVTHSYLYPGKYRVMLGVEQRKRNRRDTPEVKVNFKDIVVLPHEQ